MSSVEFFRRIVYDVGGGPAAKIVVNNTMDGRARACVTRLNTTGGSFLEVNVPNVSGGVPGTVLSVQDCWVKSVGTALSDEAASAMLDLSLGLGVNIEEEGDGVDNIVLFRQLSIIVKADDFFEELSQFLCNAGIADFAITIYLTPKIKGISYFYDWNFEVNLQKGLEGVVGLKYVESFHFLKTINVQSLSDRTFTVLDFVEDHFNIFWSQLKEDCDQINEKGHWFPPAQRNCCGGWMCVYEFCSTCNPLLTKNQIDEGDSLFNETCLGNLDVCRYWNEFIHPDTWIEWGYSDGSDSVNPSMS